MHQRGHAAVSNRRELVVRELPAFLVRIRSRLAWSNVILLRLELQANCHCNILQFRHVVRIQLEGCEPEDSAWQGQWGRHVRDFAIDRLI